mmetsp:Transcript_30606/g.68993  ORF Transcript_30606/g.68993 Transcript_30606/m.68993 type:complete len:213 (+) Transcript_30606:534-1172(+)
MPATTGSIVFEEVPAGLPGRPSARKPANAAAHARSQLKMASRPGCTTGANGRWSRGLISQKLMERSRTSTQVAGSSCVASGPGRIPFEKKTIEMYASHAAKGMARMGSWMSLLARLSTSREAEPGLKGAGSGTSKPEMSLPLASALYREQPRVKGNGAPSFSTCHCTPTVSPPSAISSMQKVKVGGSASATLNRCALSAVLPVKAPLYCVSS